LWPFGALHQSARPGTEFIADGAPNVSAYDRVISRTLERVKRADIVRRIWNKDSTVWKTEGEHERVISNSLGWLTVAEQMLKRLPELDDAANTARDLGFKHAVLLGMGGSSLCPEVLRRTFGSVDGYPELVVLDSTVPAAVLGVERRIDPARTLFIVSSKSGTTIEPTVLFKYFFDKVSAAGLGKAGRNFMAITDPGTKLENEARERDFLRIFSNQADIGGRYSALSFFGMAPAAIAGYNVRALLESALEAARSCRPDVAQQANPGLQLGAAIGALALEGRDKLSVSATRPIDSLGLWIEQLIAESTGKEGRGIFPVVDEPLGQPGSYGQDRIFVNITVSDSEIPDSTSASLIRQIESAGHPVFGRWLKNPLSLGAEFFIWEFATAVAGALLEVDPFDQPNVKESKDNTERLLLEYEHAGRFADQPLLAKDDEIEVFGTGMQGNVDSVVRSHLNKAAPGGYVALLAYIQETPEHDSVIGTIRGRLRDRLGVATSSGYGPRYLHSTGQFHKGGPDNGVFLQVTAAEPTDVAIPGEPFTFSTLKEAQALGDFQSLIGRARPVIRFHIRSDVTSGISRLLEIVKPL
jgi:glucose-6-phosphate isomerase